MFHYSYRTCLSVFSDIFFFTSVLSFLFVLSCLTDGSFCLGSYNFMNILELSLWSFLLSFLSLPFTSYFSSFLYYLSFLYNFCPFCIFCTFCLCVYLSGALNWDWSWKELNENLGRYLGWNWNKSFKVATKWTLTHLRELSSLNVISRMDYDLKCKGSEMVLEEPGIEGQSGKLRIWDWTRKELS